MHAQPGPPGASLNAYEAIAAEYDAQIRGDEWMRRALQRHYLDVFRPGQRVLDLGCGTGIDAIVLAQHGIQVVGIDASAGMISQLDGKVRRAGLETLVQGQQSDLNHLEEFQADCFDGAMSSFAALSTIDNLCAFAGRLAELIRPGGRVIVHMLNRFSVWEFLGLLRQRKLLAPQRTRSFVIGGQAVLHRQYLPLEAYQCFAEWFRLQRVYSLGALRPPHTLRRLPRGLVTGLEWLDVRLGGLPLLVNAGRFFVLDLQRTRDTTPRG